MFSSNPLDLCMYFPTTHPSKVTRGLDKEMLHHFPNRDYFPDISPFSAHPHFVLIQRFLSVLRGFSFMTQLKKSNMNRN